MRGVIKNVVRSKVKNYIFLERTTFLMIFFISLYDKMVD